MKEKSLVNRPKIPKILDDLERVAQLLPAPIYWEDVNSVILGGNEAVFSGTGALVREAYVGKTLYELYPEEMAENIKRHNEEVMKTGKILSQEEPIRDITTGALKYFTAVKMPMYDEDGKIIGIIGTSIDITKQKKAEERADQANAAKSKFLSIMSHEIRGPISNVISAVDIIKPGKVVSAEDYEKMTEIIESQAREALEIVKNTSYYLELDERKFEQRISSVYLRGYLEQLENKYQSQVSSGVTFSCHLLHTTINRVEFDKSHVSEVLKVIIDNAVEFTESGAIELSVEL